MEGSKYESRYIGPRFPMEPLVHIVPVALL